MPPPTIDPTNPEALMRELFDEDRWVKDQFAAHLGAALPEFCEALAVCFGLITAINEAASRVESRRNALVAGFMFGVLDDLVVSTKLLLTGKLPASGNLMRQVIEGIAMSSLCSTDELLVIEMKKGQRPVHARYWEKLWNDDTRVQGHRAVDQLGWNAVTLRLRDGAVEQLRRAKKHYGAFSHCGKLTIASRVSLDVVGQVHLGGHFDDAKIDAYRVELEGRINLCRVLPEFMRHLLATMQTPAAGHAEVAQAAAAP